MTLDIVSTELHIEEYLCKLRKLFAETRVYIHEFADSSYLSWWYNVSEHLHDEETYFGLTVMTKDCDIKCFSGASIPLAEHWQTHVL